MCMLQTQISNIGLVTYTKTGTVNLMTCLIIFSSRKNKLLWHYSIQADMKIHCIKISVLKINKYYKYSQTLACLVIPYAHAQKRVHERST